MSPAVTRYGLPWMCALMKWEGCAASSGSSSLTDASRAAGDDAEAGVEGGDLRIGGSFEVTSVDDDIELFGDIWDTLNPSVNGST